MDILCYVSLKDFTDVDIFFFEISEVFFFNALMEKYLLPCMIFYSRATGIFI